MYYRFTHDEGKDCCFPLFIDRGGGGSSLSLSLFGSALLQGKRPLVVTVKERGWTLR